MKLILAIRAFRVLCGLFLAATLSYGAETTAFWVFDDDNGDVRFYLDYELRYENTYTLPGETRVRGSLTDAHMTTGTGFNFNFGYCGAIDEIRISRKALAPRNFYAVATLLERLC